MVNEGKLTFRVHDVYDLQDARQAHEDLQNRKTTGSVVLRVQKG
jgi:NADPH2:quinone reductase